MHCGKEHFRTVTLVVFLSIYLAGNLAGQTQELDAIIDQEIAYVLDQSPSCQDDLAMVIDQAISMHEDDDYPLQPHWPFVGLDYYKKDIVEARGATSWATKAHNSSGRRRDISELLFKDKPLLLQDILLPSKLLRCDLLQALSAVREEQGRDVRLSEFHYLHFLGCKCIDFKTSTHRNELSLNYARHFLDNDLSFGVEIPLVHRKNNIELCSKLSQDEREFLRSIKAPQFYDRFPDFACFFNEILKGRNIEFNQSDSEFSIGDVATSLTLTINTRHAERFITGFRVRFPTARCRNINKLWDPELGNGGFFELALYAGLLFSFRHWLNPHVFVHAGWHSSADVPRRVPVFRRYDGLKPTKEVSELLHFGDEVHFTELPFCVPDTCVRRFSPECLTIRIHRGPVLNVRIGNIFDKFLFRKGQLDVYYDLFLKGRDYIGDRRQDKEFDASPLTRNSYQVDHRLGAHYYYYWDRKTRVGLGAQYSVEGRNILQNVQIDASISHEF